MYNQFNYVLIKQNMHPQETPPQSIINCKPYMAAAYNCVLYQKQCWIQRLPWIQLIHLYMDLCSTDIMYIS